MSGKEPVKILVNNKKAFFDYFIEEKYEAGIELHGTEVKSIRMGKCSIKEAYIQVVNDEMFIYNMNINYCFPQYMTNGLNNGFNNFRVMNYNNILQYC